MRTSFFGLLLAAAVVLVPLRSHAIEGYSLLALDDHLVKWGAPSLGSGTLVSYALATGPMDSPGARNCRSIVPLAGLLAGSGLAPEAFERELAAAFDLWTAAANIRFQRSPDPAAADIVIGAQQAPRGIAYANVAYREAAGGKVRSIERALICLNPERPWKIGFGGDPEVYDLRYALAHEIGHAIGLDHAGPRGQLMSFSYGETFRLLQPGDIAGALALYGRKAPTTAVAAEPRLETAPAVEVPEASQPQPTTALQ